ncbi:MAG: hypothetical protein HC769_28835 [Cyanobacteria bacterium CRU_2_1]|nr:hypothetical protein [Cyanobacteria bacterium RU_5_0]NJR62459.1 hypothetical protein [Cyanobacteria bacterium CRU_2_1]
MSTIDVSYLQSRNSGARGEDFRSILGEGTMIQGVFNPLSLIRGGGNGGDITIAATTLISTGTSNPRRQGVEILSNTRFYFE